MHAVTKCAISLLNFAISAKHYFCRSDVYTTSWRHILFGCICSLYIMQQLLYMKTQKYPFKINLLKCMYERMTNSNIVFYIKDVSYMSRMHTKEPHHHHHQHVRIPKVTHLYHRYVYLCIQYKPTYVCLMYGDSVPACIKYDVKCSVI